MPSSSLHSNLITEVCSESIYSFPETRSLAGPWRWKCSSVTSSFWPPVIQVNPWDQSFSTIQIIAINVIGVIFTSAFLSWEMPFHFTLLEVCKSLVTTLSFLWVSEEINTLSKLEIWDSLKRTWICKSNLAFLQTRHRKYRRNNVLFDKRTEQMK